MCNSLYYNLETSTICKLKSVLNSAARIVSKVNRFDRIHSLTLLKELHWLNINERVIYKILLLVFKCIHEKAPKDLVSSFQFSPRNRQNRLICHGFKSSYGERAFTVCGPTLWNSLPTHLRELDNIDIFKKGLKTYLFKKSYNC